MSASLDSHSISMTGISQPPSAWDMLVDRSTRWLARGMAIGVIALLAFIVLKIANSAIPAFRENGWSLITSATWDSNKNLFGLRASVFGTLYSSFLALVIATIFGLAIAIFLSQNFIPRKLEVVFKNIVELLAAIPSVVYGLWGIYVVIPTLRGVFKSLPFLHFDLSGPSMLPAALVLAIMVLPTISAISYDALISVNPKIKEAALGLGATRWEAILKVILPTASTGIFGSIILGFGRAMGETMALAMLLGNVDSFHFSLLQPGNTLAALIANKYPEADGKQTNVLLFAGLLLLLMTLVVNIIGAGIIQFANRGRSGARQ